MANHTPTIARPMSAETCPEEGAPEAAIAAAAAFAAAAGAAYAAFAALSAATTANAPRLSREPRGRTSRPRGSAPAMPAGSKARSTRRRFPKRSTPARARAKARAARPHPPGSAAREPGAHEPPLRGYERLGALDPERGSGQQREPHAVVRGGVRGGGEQRRGHRRRGPAATAHASRGPGTEDAAGVVAGHCSSRHAANAYATVTAASASRAVEEASSPAPKTRPSADVVGVSSFRSRGRLDLRLSRLSPSPDDARVATRRMRRSRRRTNARHALPTRSRLVADPVSSRVNLAWKPPGATRARANVIIAPLRAPRARAVALRLRRTYVAGDRDRAPTPRRGGVCASRPPGTPRCSPREFAERGRCPPRRRLPSRAGTFLSEFFFTEAQMPPASNPLRARSPPSPSRLSTRRDAAGVRDGRATRDVSTNGELRERAPRDTDLERVGAVAGHTEKSTWIRFLVLFFLGRPLFPPEILLTRDCSFAFRGRDETLSSLLSRTSGRDDGARAPTTTRASSSPRPRPPACVSAPSLSA